LNYLKIRRKNFINIGANNLFIAIHKGEKMNNPKEKVSSILTELKNFAFKGNVVDLAVGVIIGAAFGKIVDSLVKHLIMPAISVLMPAQQSYLGWKWTISGKDIPYGLFIGEIVNFIIIAIALYVFIVKFLGWVMRSKKEEEAAAPPPPTRDQELLMEIRDLLRKSGQQ